MVITSVWQSEILSRVSSFLFELNPFFHVELYMCIQEMYFYLQDNIVSNNFIKSFPFLKIGFEILIAFLTCIQ